LDGGDGGEGALDGGDGGDNLTNVQCKIIGNWHNESPLYNEYANKNFKNRINK
jgi:hypothetical protein